MALLTKVFFIGFVIIASVNGDFIIFDGNCSDISPPDDVTIDLMGKYYTIAETLNNGTETSKTDIVNQFVNITTETFVNIELFRTVKSTTGECEQAVVFHEYVKPGTYEITFQHKLVVTDGESTHFSGDIVYFLSNSVALVCRKSMDNETSEVEASVLSMEIEEFDSDRRSSVENLLKSNGLEFLNKYIKPIKQDNPCE